MSGSTGTEIGPILKDGPVYVLLRIEIPNAERFANIVSSN